MAALPPLTVGGEFDRIARLAARYGQPPAPALGIGDDAAVLAPSVRPIVVTVDAAVEHVHFERAWLDLETLGARFTEAALSDLAAMGATPAGGGIVSSLALPPSFTDDELERLAAGIARAASRAHTHVLGGNLTRGPALVITTTALGTPWRAPWLRSTASAGDAVAVSGPLGAAAIGLRMLMAGVTEGLFVSRWRDVRARFDLVAALAPYVTGCIDVSDGLAADAHHLAVASGVAVEIDANALPWLENQGGMARTVGCESLDLALHGGEDYELLVTLPKGLEVHGLTVIGEVTAGEGVWLRCNGERTRVTPRGWDHFAER